MQKSTQNATSFFSSFTFGGTKSRPGTSSGDQNQNQNQNQSFSQNPSQPQISHSRSTSNAPSPQPDFSHEFPPELAASASALNLLAQAQAQESSTFAKDRKASFARKSSFSSPSKGKRRPSTGNPTVPSSADSIPPPLPDLASAVASHFAAAGSAASPISTTAATFNSANGAPLVPVITQDAHSPLIPGDFPAPSRTLTATSLGGPNSGAMNGHGHGHGHGHSLMPAPPGVDGGAHGNIADLARKRISTLDYLRRAHEGRIYWFNTYQMERPDISRMSAANASRFARRATNFLLLGVSLPIVIDLNGATPLEYLRSLNTLLSEFETFQQLHGENSSTSSLSRARLPQMFRRPGARRRSSAATDLAYGDNMDAGSGGAGPMASANSAAFAATEADLLPGENYTHLLTPSLPFDPDFHETFATLCDMLIDCYKKLLQLIPSNKECTAPVTEQFAKADTRVRKIILQGSIKEFDDAVRSAVKVEMANLNKIVLSGLMG